MKTQKRFVPYGMNGEYYVYDNANGLIPIGFGSKRGTKKLIKSLCDDLNARENKEPEEKDHRANNRSPFGIGS